MLFILLTPQLKYQRRPRKNIGVILRGQNQILINNNFLFLLLILIIVYFQIRFQVRYIIKTRYETKEILGENVLVTEDLFRNTMVGYVFLAYFDTRGVVLVEGL